MVCRRLAAVRGGKWRFVNDVELAISARVLRKAQVPLGQAVPFGTELRVGFDAGAGTKTALPDIGIDPKESLVCGC